LPRRRSRSPRRHRPPRPRLSPRRAVAAPSIRLQPERRSRRRRRKRQRASSRRIRRGVRACPSRSRRRGGWYPRRCWGLRFRGRGRARASRPRSEERASLPSMATPWSLRRTSASAERDAMSPPARSRDGSVDAPDQGF
jgi:hypothetical protein